MFKSWSRQRWCQVMLLGGWIVIGTVLRGTQLAAKPLWSDEFSTIVFSLGHSFRTIPVDQVISATTLLQPLQAIAIGGPSAVVQRLMTESNHPPLYFLLTNLWLHALATPGALVAPEVARSLSALFGILGIPALFGLGWLLFRSLKVAQLAAALIAVSPFDVYLSQEARHYTLALLWSIASIACFATALRRLPKDRPISLGLSLTWIGVNGLGMATHFFFALLLGAEALTLAGFAVRELFTPARCRSLRSRAGQRISLVAGGTLCTCLVWGTVWQGNRDSDLTSWVLDPYRSGWGHLDPLRYAVTTLINFLTLFPVRWPHGAILGGVSGLAVGCSLGSVYLLGQGWRRYLKQGGDRRMVWIIAGLAIGAISLLCLVDYGLGMRLASNSRYAFAYCPAVLLLIAVGLAPHWQTSAAATGSSTTGSSTTGAASNRQRWGGKGAIALLLLVSLFSSLAVAFNFGFQKNHRADIIAQDIQTLSQAAAIVGISHHTHAQTGRLMGIALQLNALAMPSATTTPTQFYFDYQPCDSATASVCDVPTAQFRQTLAHQPQPFDLWLLEYRGVPDLTEQQCRVDPAFGTRRIPGFNYQHYRCTASSGGA